MERSLSIEQGGIGTLEHGRRGYGDVVERLSQMLEVAKSGDVSAISYVLDPPYNTPDGKPLQVHWYTPTEIAELNQ